MTPTVSVLMPVYNGCRLGQKVLKMAIDSILLQTFKDFEFVIVDDGSDDETAEVVSAYRDPRIKLIRQHNTGIVGALNAGILQCTGEFVARQDADDFSVVTRFAHQVKFMVDNPDVSLVGTRMWVVDKDGQILTEIKDRPLEDDQLRYFLKHTGCPFVHGSVMMRREDLVGLGGYSADEQYRHAEDYRLWVEFAAKGKKLANLPITLYYHRNHQSKISSVHSGAQVKATERIIRLAKQTIK